jgi:hypothetical protein
MSNLEQAISTFDAVEANLVKLEKIWEQIRALMPSDIAFGAPPAYDELCFAFRNILPSMPAINNFRIEDKLFEYDEIGQMWLDVNEVGEADSRVYLMIALDEQGKKLGEYRLHFAVQRSKLVRERMLELIDGVDQSIRNMAASIDPDHGEGSIQETDQSHLQALISEMNVLLGSTRDRPDNWIDLQRHLRFGEYVDLVDIVRHDWPTVKKGLMDQLYGQYDPLPVNVDDLEHLVASKPKGRVASALRWDMLDATGFERLIFLLIADSEGYENPEWLQQTNAPDRGRDLSVTRTWSDSLSGVRRQRVIIQCKHWVSRSIGPNDISSAIAMMKLWEPPRVDVLVFAASGRFSVAAISLVEKHNQDNTSLNIDMWPDSHLERILAAKPHLVAEFGLRRSPD